MRRILGFTILALSTAVGCGGTSTTAPKQEQPPMGAKPQDPTPEKSGAHQAQPQQVPFSELYGGMIMARVTTPGVVPPSGTAKVRTLYLIRDAQGFASFKARVPKNFISKGPPKPNTDPILKATGIDFAKKMLLIVEYDYMWVKPRVLGVTSNGKSLLVRVKFDEEMAIKQHASGVASYTAVAIPLCSLTPRLVTN